MRPLPLLPTLLALSALSSAPAAAQGAPIIIGTGEPFYVPLNDLQLSGAGNHPTVTLNGDLYLEAPSVQICIGSDPNGTGCSGGGVAVRFDIKAGMALELVADDSGSIEADIDLPPVIIGYFFFPLFPSITGAIQISGKFVIAGEVEAGMRVGVVGSFDADGAAISNQRAAAGYHAPENVAFEVSPPELTGASGLDLQVAFEAGVFVAIQVSGLTVSTPYMKVRSGVELSVDPSGDPWWDVNGFVVPIAGWDFALSSTPSMAMAPNPFLFDVADAGGPLPAGWLAESARWSRTYDLLDSESIEAVSEFDDGWIVAGQDGGAGARGWLARIDAAGDVVWEQRSQFVLQALTKPNAVHRLPADQVAVSGYDGSSFGARLDVYDALDGTPLWTRGWLDVNGDAIEFESMIVTADGDFAFGGDVNRSGANHPMVVRTDPAGNVRWAREFVLDAPAGADDGEGVQLVETPDGHLVLFGDVIYSDGPTGSATIGSRNAFVLSLEGDGDFDWARAVGGPYYDYGTCGTVVDGGDLVLGGLVGLEGESSWIARLDPDGTLLWSRTLAGEVTDDPNTGNTANDLVRGICAVEGGARLVGTTGIGSHTESWIAKVDHDGDVVWFKSLRGPNNDELHGIAAFETGLIAWGRTRSLQPLGAGGAEDEMWLVRAPNDGMLHFDAGFGFETWNDLRESGPTVNVVGVNLPGTLQSMTLVDDVVTQLLDVTASAVTLLTL